MGKRYAIITIVKEGKDMSRYLIMHKAEINGKMFDCLFKIVCDGSRAKEALAEAIAATGDRTMWLEKETADDLANAWYVNPS